MKNTQAAKSNLVTPVSPVAAYVGGKKMLARHIAGLISAIPHATYVEPFVGMGGVFFRRASRPKGEVINDISKEVITLFRILQRHHQPLMDLLRWQLTSRAEWQRLMSVPPDTLTDLERAARFLYLQRLSFGGNVTKTSFGLAVRMPARFDIVRLGEILSDVHERLSSVVIECLPYADLISRYDRPDTLFYLDPPYFGCEDMYGAGVFARDDFQRLADLLSGIDGRFIMSINDHPKIRAIFKGFSIEPIAVRYTLSSRAEKRRDFGELIITKRGRS
jgi:DNA adenine methylase